MVTETLEKVESPVLTREARAIIESFPDFILYKSDSDYALLPSGDVIRLRPEDYREPEHKKYPDAVPIVWESWLRGPDPEGVATLSVGGASVIAATGLKGSGKSETLALLSAKALACGLPVWSNMGVKFWLIHDSGKLEYCASLPLDWNAVLLLSKELDHGALVIDELSYYCSSRQSSSVRNRIINAAINQVRKRTLDFYTSVKFLRQIDINVREELDCHISCEDIARSFKGQEMRLDKGCWVKWLVRDISGWSGKPQGLVSNQSSTWNDLDRLGEPIYANEGATRIFTSRFTWPIYNSYDVVETADAFRKVRLDLQEIVISDKASAESIKSGLSEIVTLFTEQGEYMPDTATFRNMVAKAGLRLTDTALGTALKSMGIRRKRMNKGQFYELPEGGVE